MMMVKERMNGRVESSGMLGDVQGGFRRGRIAFYVGMTKCFYVSWM